MKHGGNNPNVSTRRDLIRDLAKGAIIAGFHPGTRSWVTAAELPANTALVGLSAFDGRLVTDDSSLTSAADDFGHIVHRRPIAVLQPGSVQDIVRMVRFAREHHIRVAARGQGHSTQGQAQVEAGVVIDMSFLRRIRSMDPVSAWVDGGVRWIDLLQQTLARSLTPPVFTDFIELSIGGTLSVGGIGGQTFRWGTQTDNVLELEVITGRGELVICSAFSDSGLFHVCRAGLGQYGIITGARIRLTQAQPMARTYTALYSDLGVFMADQLRVIHDRRFDYVEGSLAPQPGGGWAFQIELTKYFSTPPNDAALLAGLSFSGGTLVVVNQSYFDFINRLAPLVAILKQTGVWGLPHPWVNLFLPVPEAQRFVASVVSTLTVEDVGQGPVLLYPANRLRVLTPLFRLPAARDFYLLAILRNAVPSSPARISELIQANRRLFDQCVAVGGKRYPIDSVPMSRQDWERHYQPLWSLVVASKQHFDPDNILTPGQGIFA
jgi:cytokinin dehydrogenase